MADEYQAVYTHGHHESVLRGHRVRTAENSAGYLLPHLRPGLSVLDVGCGPGTITVDLAARVSPGQVTAIEMTKDALDLARTEAKTRGQSNIDFVTSDVHVANPVQALREMRRVCKPGGIVAARDADYAGFTWFPQLPPLDRWMTLYCAAARANGGEPDAGRRLLSWAQHAGFDDITPTGGLWCFATPETRDWWGGMWADRIVESALSRQLVESEMATAAELDEIASAWRDWAAAPDGWLAIPHGEILCRG
jgi:SAM-dependent methyltransferase